MKKTRLYLAILLASLAIFLAIWFFLSGSIGKNAEAADMNYDWQLTFEDNFDTFDQTKWITFFDTDRRTIWSNKELQWYNDNNVTAVNGVLKLTAKRESIYGKDIESEKQFDYTSGMICSGRSFTQAYGKWEMKVRFPYKKGFFPAFFLVPKQWPTLPEIDVFEYFSINKNKISCNHHWGIDYTNAGGSAYEGKTAPFYYAAGKELNGNFDDRWMVWSFECFPNEMVWKLDGKTVYEAKEGIPTAPLYMIVNVAVKDWPQNDNIVDNSGLPYVMEIDYIRVYKMVPKN